MVDFPVFNQLIQLVTQHSTTSYASKLIFYNSLNATLTTCKPGGARTSSNVASQAHKDSMSATNKASRTVNPKRKAPTRNKASTNTGQKKMSTKKGTSTGDLQVELTEENLALYKALQAKLEAQKKVAAAAENEGKSLVLIF